MVWPYCFPQGVESQGGEKEGNSDEISVLYHRIGCKVNMSISFALSYALSFASLTASFTHVALHNGRDIWKMWKNSKRHAKEKVEDVHTRLMKRNNKPVPNGAFLRCYF
ncbi:hypothetical protein HPP92_027045 [Vanilla planifolia]|uniref:Uncharacterized protein n=1 Tax=Vanilla planifolia TaxID=51239 RepID=A0A835U6B0_VANPL|nr:hypothetical protein HPP92_027045 [Vanilla planifolia]